MSSSVALGRQRSEVKQMNVPLGICILVFAASESAHLKEAECIKTKLNNYLTDLLIRYITRLTVLLYNCTIYDKEHSLTYKIHD